jgi:hypothetical protein
LDIENQIGLCSEIISLACKLEKSNLRNAIMKHVGNHRQALRAESDSKKTFKGD